MASSPAPTDDTEPFEALIIGGDPGGLPMRLHALLDPDRPLDHPERFFPDDVAMPVLGYGVMAVCAACCAGFVASAVKALTGGPAVADLVISLGLLAFFAWPTRWGWAQVGAHRRQKKLLDAGRYRVGVFVHRDGLLINDADGKITWLPRHAIVALQTGRAPGSEGGASPVVGWVEYRDPQGQVVIERLPSYRVSSRMLALRLRDWLDGKPFEPPTRP